jgi:hypothetical protein
LAFRAFLLPFFATGDGDLDRERHFPFPAALAFLAILEERRFFPLELEREPLALLFDRERERERFLEADRERFLRPFPLADFDLLLDPLLLRFPLLLLRLLLLHPLLLLRPLFDLDRDLERDFLALEVERLRLLPLGLLSFTLAAGATAVAASFPLLLFMLGLTASSWSNSTCPPPSSSSSDCTISGSSSI